jgi:hypothetical protein
VLGPDAEAEDRAGNAAQARKPLISRMTNGGFGRSRSAAPATARCSARSTCMRWMTCIGKSRRAALREHAS